VLKRKKALKAFFLIFVAKNLASFRYPCWYADLCKCRRLVRLVTRSRTVWSKFYQVPPLMWLILDEKFEPNVSQLNE